jgi:hypothetical protein
MLRIAKIDIFHKKIRILILKEYRISGKRKNGINKIILNFKKSHMAVYYIDLFKII